MKIYIPQKAKTFLGGGGSFTRNIIKALKDKVEFVSSWQDCDVYLIPGCTLAQRDEVTEAKKAGKRIILRIDNIPRNSRNRNTGTSRLYDMAQMADEVIYQSHWAREFIQPFVKKNGAVILNGVDTSIFKPEGDKYEKDGSPQYLYSRFNRDETKRWEKAWYLFQKNYFNEPSSHLWIVGKFSPTNFEYNFDLFGGAEKRYKFWGMIEDPEEMAKIYRSADVLFMTYDMDACSNVLIEALHCRLKVLWEKVKDSSVNEIIKTPLEKLTLEEMGRRYLEVFKKVV